MVIEKTVEEAKILAALIVKKEETQTDNNIDSTNTNKSSSKAIKPTTISKPLKVKQGDMFGVVVKSEGQSSNSMIKEENHVNQSNALNERLTRKRKANIVD